MKKLFTILCALVLGSALTFAQAGGGTTGTQAPADSSKPADSGKKAHKASKKGHKGGKKSKKSTPPDSTTPPPK